MHVTPWRPEHPVFVELRLTHTQHVTCGLERWQVRVFVGRVADNEQDVDDLFRCETRNGGRADVFDTQRPLTECPHDRVRMLPKGVRPARLVLGQREWPSFGLAEYAGLSSGIHCLTSRASEL